MAWYSDPGMILPSIRAIAEDPATELGKLLPEEP